jgi:hypothetical protein
MEAFYLLLLIGKKNSYPKEQGFPTLFLLCPSKFLNIKVTSPLQFNKKRHILVFTMSPKTRKAVLLGSGSQPVCCGLPPSVVQDWKIMKFFYIIDLHQ